MIQLSNDLMMMANYNNIKIKSIDKLKRRDQNRLLVLRLLLRHKKNVPRNNNKNRKSTTRATTMTTTEYQKLRKVTIPWIIIPGMSRYETLTPDLVSRSNQSSELPFIWVKGCIKVVLNRNTTYRVENNIAHSK